MASVLSPGQRLALGNLARKQAGEEVDWINISDARSLTDLGFAVRGREGWEITPKGLSALEGADRDDPAVEPHGSSDHEPIPMKGADHEGN